MITLLGVLEKGYESTFEHLAYRQIRGAYLCRLVCVPHDYPTLQEALDKVSGTKVFLLPPGRVTHSTEFAEFVMPEGDVVFCFGSPQETMVKFIGEDIVLHITTTGTADMMAVTVAGMVMYVHG
jgi:hypothetical protein